jgi:excinuclease UvrABC helicase subunit UvrB
MEMDRSELLRKLVDVQYSRNDIDQFHRQKIQHEYTFLHVKLGKFPPRRHVL